MTFNSTASVLKIDFYASFLPNTSNFHTIAIGFEGYVIDDALVL